MPQVLVLAGGLGSRLRTAVPGIPKVLAPIHGRPALEWQLRLFGEQGLTDFVLAVGYRAMQVETYFGDGSRFGWRVRYAHECQPLGTAGAIQNALSITPDLASTAFLTCNGDTYAEADFTAFFATHSLSRNLATIGLAPTADARAGGLIRRAGDRIVGFEEKPGECERGWINTGFYIFDPSIRQSIATQRAVSLEDETLPALLAAGARIGSFDIGKPFFDMGSPAGLAKLAAHLAP